MKHSIRTLVPVLALAVFGFAACDDGDDGTGPNTTTADIRFVNLIPDASGNLLLTANNTAVGSALAFGSASGTCVAVPTGNAVNLAFGTANSGGTGISGTALATSTANLTTDGNFTVVAAGTAANPQIFFLNNTTTAPTGTNAALRFISTVTSGSFDVFLSSDGTTLTTPIATSVAFGSAGSGFVTIPAGTGTLVFTEAGTQNVSFTMPSSTTLTAGQIGTVVLAPGAGGTGFQTLMLNACS